MNNPGREDLEVRETFKLASEFAPHVTVTEETFFGHGWQPLTTSMLMSLWFLPADTTFDIPFLVNWFQRLGWKGANGKPLGAPVVRREIGLMREAGYITAVRLRGEGGKTVGIQYSVSQRRSDQPEDGTWLPVAPGSEENRRSDHVRSMPTRGESPHVANGENRRSDHVRSMPTRGESPHVANAAKPQVAPRVANEVSPPHPPEGGGGTPPPNPRTKGRALKADRYTELCALAPGDYQPTAEETAAADAFLQDLPGKWQMGPDEARMLAPLLASRIHTQGYELDTFLELVLVQDDPANPAKVPSRVMPSRLRNLKRKRTEDKPVPAAPDSAGGRAELEWCGQCNDGELPALPYMRLRELPDGRHAPCTECHPKYART